MVKAVSRVQAGIRRASSRDPQIVVRLLPTTKDELETYARVHWIDTASLLRLLLRREAHLQQLTRLTQSQKAALLRRQPRGSAVRPGTVATRLPSLRDVDNFDEYAAKCGLKRDPAAGWLVENELRERWLG